MRVLLTSDLHHNNHRSRPVAEELIAQINRTPADVLVLIGDTAVVPEGALEQCLKQFTFSGKKLFVPGNHELWLRAGDSHRLYTTELPQLVKSLGWQWLPTDSFVTEQIAIVGSLGWYDYSFAAPGLGIPKRFYEAKISPGAAPRFDEYAGLLHPSADISPAAREVIARWNDGKFVSLGRSDEAFLDELLDTLKNQLEALRNHPRVVAAIHQLPFKELLPPVSNGQWDFSKAYLGSSRIGELLLKYPNVKQLYCGHSHYPAEVQVGHIHATNTGCGYSRKFIHTLDVDENL